MIGLDHNNEPEYVSAEASRLREEQEDLMHGYYRDAITELAKSEDDAGRAFLKGHDDDALPIAISFLHIMAKIQREGATEKQIAEAMQSLFTRTVTRMVGDETWDQY